MSAAETAPLPPARPWTGARITGHALIALWIALGVAMAWFLVASWSPEFFTRYLPWYAEGLLTTVILVTISIVLGAVLSVPIAYMRMSSSKLLRAIAYGYVYFFRGTPLLAQVFLVYYGFGALRVELEAVGLWWFFREAWYCAIFSFSLNTSAYQAEILRGAIQSVPRGQWEGAASLGLHKWQTLRRIILPQALIVALRPYGNEIILMIKGSAVVALITVYDLMGMTRRIYSSSFDFQAYIWAGIIYMSIVEVLRIGTETIEPRITAHLKR
jgi:polar amino acid transport system permease protein